MSGAYYNEIDPYAAQWIRNLITAGHIADGDVDERSITDVHADDLKEFTQCHFFAGIGVWSYALRRAGWDDSRPVWTGSCPCQPFSVAGNGAGTTDERHLWPTFFKLINQRRPAVVFGEQVEAAIKHGWLDLVQTDMEGIGYAFGAAGIPAAGVGAPHIRQRLFFVGELADTEIGRSGTRRADDATRLQVPSWGSGSGESSVLADTALRRCERQSEQHPAGVFRTVDGKREKGESISPYRPSTSGLDNNNNTGLEGFWRGLEATGRRDGAVRPVAETGEFGGMADASGGRVSQMGRGEIGRVGQPGSVEEPGSAGPINGFWRNADWLFCRDGKWRPVMPKSFPLAHGASARVGRLRAYGNAICAQVAEEFIAAYLSVRP